MSRHAIFFASLTACLAAPSDYFTDGAGFVTVSRVLGEQIQTTRATRDHVYYATKAVGDANTRTSILYRYSPNSDSTTPLRDVVGANLLLASSSDKVAYCTEFEIGIATPPDWTFRKSPASNCVSLSVGPHGSAYISDRSGSPTVFRERGDGIFSQVQVPYAEKLTEGAISIALDENDRVHIYAAGPGFSFRECAPDEKGCLTQGNGNGWCLSVVAKIGLSRSELAISGEREKRRILLPSTNALYTLPTVCCDIANVPADATEYVKACTPATRKVYPRWPNIDGYATRGEHVMLLAGGTLAESPNDSAASFVNVGFLPPTSTAVALLGGYVYVTDVDRLQRLRLAPAAPR